MVLPRSLPDAGAPGRPGGADADSAREGLPLRIRPHPAAPGAVASVRPRLPESLAAPLAEPFERATPIPACDQKPVRVSHGRPRRDAVLRILRPRGRQP